MSIEILISRRSGENLYNRALRQSACFPTAESPMVRFYTNWRHDGQASKGPVLLPAVRHFPYQFPCYTSKEILVPETKETDRLFYASDQ